MGDRAFADCPNLTSVSLIDAYTFGSELFDGLSLECLELHATEAFTMEDDTLSGIKNTEDTHLFLDNNKECTGDSSPRSDATNKIWCGLTWKQINDLEYNEGYYLWQFDIEEVLERAEDNVEDPMADYVESIYEHNVVILDEGTLTKDDLSALLNKVGVSDLSTINFHFPNATKFDDGAFSGQSDKCYDNLYGIYASNVTELGTNPFADADDLGLLELGIKTLSANMLYGCSIDWLYLDAVTKIEDYAFGDGSNNTEIIGLYLRNTSTVTTSTNAFANLVTGGDALYLAEPNLSDVEQCNVVWHNTRWSTINQLTPIQVCSLSDIVYTGIQYEVYDNSSIYYGISSYNFIILDSGELTASAAANLRAMLYSATSSNYNRTLYFPNATAFGDGFLKMDNIGYFFYISAPNVTSIGESAFENVKVFGEFDSVVTIGDRAFAGGTQALVGYDTGDYASYTFPKATTFGKEVFSGCGKLSLKIPAVGNFTCDADMFSGVDSFDELELCLDKCTMDVVESYVSSTFAVASRGESVDYDSSGEVGSDYLDYIKAQYPSIDTATPKVTGAKVWMGKTWDTIWWWYTDGTMATELADLSY